MTSGGKLKIPVCQGSPDPGSTTRSLLLRRCRQPHDQWLQNPFGSLKVTPVTPVPSPRKPTTINSIMCAVLGFYDYLMRHEDYSIQLSKRLKKTIPGSRRGFKDFLCHINKGKEYSAKILKLKAPPARMM